MNPEIERRWKAAEERRMAFVEKVRQIPVDKQNARPQGGGFSPVELVMHMAMSDLVTAERVRKRPPATLSGSRRKPSFIYGRVLSAMQNGLRVPAPRNMVPKGDLTLEDAESSWEAARAEIATYLDLAATPETVIQQTLIFGRLSAFDVLALMEAHQSYHERYFPEP